MNNSQRQLRLLNLVRKLLKLGRSNSNAHEAGLALQRARPRQEASGVEAEPEYLRRPEHDEQYRRGNDDHSAVGDEHAADHAG